MTSGWNLTIIYSIHVIKNVYNVEIQYYTWFSHNENFDSLPLFSELQLSELHEFLNGILLELAEVFATKLGKAFPKK